tara:strand:+ start:1046 stop:1771 length:726 start_codon:yes stop_codon:yes gene_type:complete
MRNRLKAILNNQKDKFLEAKPFPHIIIDNFLEPELANKLSTCFEIETIQRNKNWTHHHNENADRYRLEDEFYMDKELQAFARYTNSRDFILFLEGITSYKSLIGDPYFVGGGAMSTSRGGFLKMHVDFNWSHKLQLWRKINFIIYLTKDWEKEWGGELVLESKNSDLEKKIVPLFNRAVIFKVDNLSFHGQPKPLSCPKNKLRSLFSSFYYSSDKFKTTSEEPHFTKYQIENSPISKSLSL